MFQQVVTSVYKDGPRISTCKSEAKIMCSNTFALVVLLLKQDSEQLLEPLKQCPSSLTDQTTKLSHWQQGRNLSISQDKRHVLFVITLPTLTAEESSASLVPLLFCLWTATALHCRSLICQQSCQSWSPTHCSYNWKELSVFKNNYLNIHQHVPHFKGLYRKLHSASRGSAIWFGFTFGEMACRPSFLYTLWLLDCCQDIWTRDFR